MHAITGESDSLSLSIDSMSNQILTEVVQGVHRPSTAVPIEGTQAPPPSRAKGWRPKTNEHLVDMTDILGDDDTRDVSTTEPAPTKTDWGASGPQSLTPPGDVPSAARSTASIPGGDDASASPSRTVVNLGDEERTSPDAAKQGHKGGRFQQAEGEWIASEEANVAGRVEEGKREDAKRGGAEVKLSQSRKWFLLGIFCLSQVSSKQVQKANSVRRYSRIFWPFHFHGTNLD